MFHIYYIFYWFFIIYFSCSCLFHLFIYLLIRFVILLSLFVISLFIDWLIHFCINPYALVWNDINRAQPSCSYARAASTSLMIHTDVLSTSQAKHATRDKHRVSIHQGHRRVYCILDPIRPWWHLALVHKPEGLLEENERQGFGPEVILRCARQGIGDVPPRRPRRSLFVYCMAYASLRHSCTVLC